MSLDRVGCAGLIARATGCGVRLFKTDLPGGEIVNPDNHDEVICAIAVAQFKHPATSYQSVNISAPLLSDTMNHATDIAVPAVLCVVFARTAVLGTRLAPALPYPLIVKQQRVERTAQKTGKPFDPGERWFQFNPRDLIPLERVLDGH